MTKITAFKKGGFFKKNHFLASLAARKSWARDQSHAMAVTMPDS